jgi:hypothetical protein
MSPTKNHILISLSSSEKTSFGKQVFACQSDPQKVFSAIWAVESDVNNGGFREYFLNSPESASFVVEALERIGAPKTAAICKRAIDTAFIDGLPEAEEAIRTAAFRPGILFVPSRPYGLAVCFRVASSRGIRTIAEGR